MRNKGKYKKISWVLLSIAALLINFNVLAQNDLKNLYDSSKSFADNKTTIFNELQTQPLETTALLGQINQFEKESQALYTLQLCKLLNKKRKYDRIPELLDKCISDFTQIGYNEALGDCYFYKGKMSKVQNNPEKVIEFYELAYEHFVSYQNMDHALIAIMEIANHFSKNGNNIYASKYYDKAHDIAENEQVKESYKESLQFNTGNHYYKTGDYKNALKYYKQVEVARMSRGQDEKLSRLKNNIGVAYINLGILDSAEIKLTEALKIREKKNDSIQIASTLLNMFRLTLDQKNVQKARQVDKRLGSILESQKNIAPDVLVAYSYDKIKLYHLTNQSQLAQKEFVNYINLKDSLTESAFSDKLINIEKSYEIEERDKNIALLEQKESLSKATVKNQWLVIYFTITLILTLLTLGYFINRQRIKLQKSENNLQKKQREVERINNELTVSNQAKDRILSIIGHDLRGPIGGLKELIELYLELPGYDENDFKNLLKVARESSTSSYLLLENLLTWANSQRGHIDFNPVETPFLPLVKQIVQLLNSATSSRNVTFEFKFPPALIINADVNMLRTIIRNLLSNAIKYSPQNSSITISAEQDELSTHICIADKGNGMSAKQTSALFDKKETYYIETGYNAKGTGLGLILCKEFVDQHKGQIWADSEPNAGTTICFSIPHNFEESPHSNIYHKQPAVEKESLVASNRS